MKENAGSRIPSFTKAESKLVKGAFDFIGVVHYMAIHVSDKSSNLALEHRDYVTDSATKLVGMRVHIYNITIIEACFYFVINAPFHFAMEYITCSFFVLADIDRLTSLEVRVTEIGLSLMSTLVSSVYS